MELKELKKLRELKKLKKLMELKKLKKLKKLRELKKLRILLATLITYHLSLITSPAQDVYCNQEVEQISRFLTEVEYTRESESLVDEYNVPLPVDRVLVLPVIVPVPETDFGYSTLTLTYSDNADFSNAVTIELDSGSTEVKIWNLVPSSIYYYDMLADGTTIAKGRIHTQGRLRAINMELGFNFRDLGGWHTADGRRLRYGRIIRGGELNGTYVATPEDIQTLLSLGITAEVDMRYTNENPGAGHPIVPAASQEGEATVPAASPASNYLFTNNFPSQLYMLKMVTYQRRVKEAFNFILAHLQQGGAVYMHCIWGADRTGMMAFLMEGLLGVSYSDMMKEYELTSFLCMNTKKKSHFDSIMDYIETFSGETLQQKFNTFFIEKIGVSQTDIDAFIAEMTEEYQEEVTPYSGTLPVVYVNTLTTIDSKDYYSTAFMYIDALGLDGYKSVASEWQPLEIGIRGRGNWTWFGPFEKKPYKIKLAHGEKLLGMKSNKHFALLAHADGGEKAYFRNTAGFELGRMVGLHYTPHQQPVELMLNGEYQGLYFLTETVRVGKHRVNIPEQADKETDPTLVRGGWLVEIDNADEPEHQVMPPIENTELTRFCVTYHSPEVLSKEQYNYLYSEMSDIVNLVYVADKYSREWEYHIDMDTLARYYLVNEMIDHLEAFLGSCYIYKDREDPLWKFGPLWDLGQAFNDWHPNDTFIWQYRHETEDDWEPCIMEELAKFPRLQERINELWKELAPVLYPAIEQYLRDFADQIAAAAVLDRQRWPLYGTPDAHATLEKCLASLEEKRQFLIRQWGDPEVLVSINDIEARRSRPSQQFYNLQGQAVSRISRSGLYIRNGRKYLR